VPTLTATKQILRVARGWGFDVVRRPRPTTVKEIPAFGSSITPEWATQALCAGTDVRVTGARYESLHNGSTCRGLLHLTYDPPQHGPDALPPTVFVKSTSSFRTRLQVGAMGGTRGEMRFYSEIAPTVDIVAPGSYYGASDRRSGRSVLLLEDLAARPGVEFCHVLKTTLDRAGAEAMVDSLAEVHGCLLGSPRFGTDLRWTITSLKMQEAQNAFIDFERRTVVGFDRAGDTVPTAFRFRRNEIHGGLMRALALDADRTLGIVHSDVHMGNWYVDEHGRMGLYDWSAVVRGQGTRDLAYALGANLRTEDRRAWERELVERYADRVGQISGTPQDADALWLSYRQQTLHALTYWLYTLGAGRLQPAMQPSEVSLTYIGRIAQAAVDLDTFAALDASSV
jgi:hypothetical protein